MKIRGKPDLNEFLEGGVESPQSIKKNKDDANKSSISVDDHLRQKLVQLPAKMLMDLKLAALNETEQSGKRVTESDIVKRSLGEYLYK
jgi:hypothetical protein